MAVSFPRLPQWLWGGSKEREAVSNGSSLTPSSDAVSFPRKIRPSARKTKGKWFGREERRTEGECKAVFEEPEGPEWSIGWVEPHGPSFGAGDGEDGGFVVLVPCYKKVVDGSSNQLMGVISNNLPNGFTPGGKNYMEQWLSSLQKL